MKLSISIFLSLLIAYSSSAYSALFEYRFSGAISQRPIGTTIHVGDLFEGRWVVETDQDGESLPWASADTDGRLYDLRRLTIELGGATLDIENAGGVSVSETEVGVAFPTIWPSGFSSDYTVSSFLVPEIPLWGTEVSTFGLTFSYDGRGVWDTFSLPSNFDFLANTADQGIFIFTSGTGIGSGVNIFGGIHSVSVSEVPLPGPFYLFELSVALLIAARKKTLSQRIASKKPPNKEMNRADYRMLFNPRMNIVANKKHSVSDRLSRRYVS